MCRIAVTEGEIAGLQNLSLPRRSWFREQIRSRNVNMRPCLSRNNQQDATLY